MKKYSCFAVCCIIICSNSFAVNSYLLQSGSNEIITDTISHLGELVITKRSNNIKPEKIKEGTYLKVWVNKKKYSGILKIIDGKNISIGDQIIAIEEVQLIKRKQNPGVILLGVLLLLLGLLFFGLTLGRMPNGNLFYYIGGLAILGSGLLLSIRNSYPVRYWKFIISKKLPD